MAGCAARGRIGIHLAVFMRERGMPPGRQFSQGDDESETLWPRKPRAKPGWTRSSCVLCLFWFFFKCQAGELARNRKLEEKEIGKIQIVRPTPVASETAEKMEKFAGGWDEDLNAALQFV